jgi:hypothetical protein
MANTSSYTLLFPFFPSPVEQRSVAMSSNFFSIVSSTIEGVVVRTLLSEAADFGFFLDFMMTVGPFFRICNEESFKK